MIEQRPPSHTKLGVRLPTKAKYDAIARHQRWTLAETADALADRFIEQHGIPLPTTPSSMETAGQNAGDGQHQTA